MFFLIFFSQFLFSLCVMDLGMKRYWFLVFFESFLMTEVMGLVWIRKRGRRRRRMVKIGNGNVDMGGGRWKRWGGRRKGEVSVLSVSVCVWGLILEGKRPETGS